MHFQEPKLPKRLKETQEWFASIITQPLDGNSRIVPRTPRGLSITKEAASVISPSPSLQAHERIEIYNQQYWWRLINALQEAFPLVLRLFGFVDFNQTIAIPYLKKYPPNDWTLNVLGDRLAKWVAEKYKAEDKELVLNATLVDSAFNYAFFVMQMPPLSIQDLRGSEAEQTLQVKLYLQPHVQLFKLPYDLFTFRKEFLKESPEYWVENDFPEFNNDKEYHFMLFRKPNNHVSWREISYPEYAILRKFSLGDSIEKICRWIEIQNNSLQEEAESKLSEWFQIWTAESLLTRHFYQKP